MINEIRKIYLFKSAPAKTCSLLFVASPPNKTLPFIDGSDNFFVAFNLTDSTVW